MRVLLQKQLGAFRPADDDADTLLGKLKAGEFVWADIKRPRNLLHHRKFWKLMQIVTDNQQHYRNAEEVCTAFKFAIGHTSKLKTARGIVEIPRSIAFHKLGQGEFETFYDKAVDFLCTEVIPGMNNEALRCEVEELLQPRTAA